MFAAGTFQLAFHFPHARGFGFQFIFGFFYRLRKAYPPCRCFLLVQQPQQALGRIVPDLQLTVAPGHFCLLGQVQQLLIQLMQDIGHAQ